LTMLGARRISLSPVVKVKRQHIRLDRKTLILFAREHCRHDPKVQELIELEKRQKGSSTADPKRLLPSRPVPHRATTPAAAVGDDPEEEECAEDVREDDPVEPLTEEQTLTHQAAVAAWQKQVKECEATQAYVEQLSRYNARVCAESAVINAVFQRAASKRIKSGWQFDGSVVTDGVAVSLQYSKTIRVPAAAPVAKPRRKGAECDIAYDEEYDKRVSTVIRDPQTGKIIGVVLGVDPGRANIATVAYWLDEVMAKDVKAKASRKSWGLTRGAYYELGGIRKLNKRQAVRFKTLQTAFERLGDDSGSVRTVELQDVKRYLTVYSKIREQWWSLALLRRESRDQLQRYAGKRSVLDSFFAKVLKQVKDAFPGAQVSVGYGHCVQSMKSSGKGELSVPTSQAFKACKRVFGPSRVKATDEWGTTVMDFESGGRKEAVYRVVSERPDGVARRRGEHARYRFTLGHTACKTMPLASEADRDAVQDHKRWMAERSKRRRSIAGSAVDRDTVFDGGLASRERTENGTEREKEEKSVEAKPRYSEVRGLRFCQERRMYLSRDAASAEAIAKLRTIELQGKARPAPFHRSYKTHRPSCNEKAAADGGADALYKDHTPKNIQNME
jgi:hypothetical protein